MNRLAVVALLSQVLADSTTPTAVRVFVSPIPIDEAPSRITVSPAGAEALAALGGTGAALATVVASRSAHLLGVATDLAEESGSRLRAIAPLSFGTPAAGEPHGDREAFAAARGHARMWLSGDARLSPARLDAETLLEGRVMDRRAGLPVADALVRADPRDDDPFTVTSIARTNADGRFRLQGLGTTPVSLTVSAAGFERGGLSEALPGQVAEIVLDPVGKLSGVARAAGRPVAAVVTVGGSGLFPPVSRRSAADGSFEVSPIPNGIYWIRAESPGGDLVSESGPVDVTTELPHRTVELELLAGVRVNGTVRTASGAPVAGAAVFLGRSELAAAPALSIADGSGRFIAVVQREGPVFATLLAAGLPPLRAFPVRSCAGRDGCGDPNRDTKADAGASANQLALELPPSGVVKGRVFGPSDEPVEGARIEVTTISAEHGLHVTSALTHQALAVVFRKLGVAYNDSRVFRTDSGGRFRLSGVLAGKVTVRASHPAFASGISRETDLPASGEIDFSMRLSRAIAVAGVVEDTAGRAVPGAAIRLINLATRRCESVARTGSDGRFRLRASPGRKRVEVVHDPFAPTAIETVVTATVGRDDVRITLHEGSRSIEGRVVDEADRPVEGVEVTLRLVGARVPTHRTTITDDSGRFAVFGLPEGAYSLNAAKDGYPTARRSRVPEGHEIEVRLVAGGRIVGRVTRDRFRLVDAFRVTIAGIGLSADGNDGRFEIGPLSQGEHKVVISAPGLVTAATRVFVAAGKTEEIEVDMGEAAAISGEVIRRDDGAPVPGARITVGTQSGVSDSNGRFRIDGIRPGVVQLKVVADGFSPLTGESIELRRGEESGALRLELDR